jgi:hypothetical protein
MQQALEPERCAAIMRLQRLASQRDPSSFEFAVSDHAITLLLNPTRPIDSFSVRNAWRDARSVILRQRGRARERGMLPLHGTGAESSTETEATYFHNAGRVDNVDAPFVWADAYRRLRAALVLRNRYAAACLDAWRDGEEEHTTAAALGISREYVKKLRRLIRDVAAELLGTAEVAQ